MKFVIDTHVLFWYLIPNKKLKQETREVLRSAKDIFIPTIVILELFYIMSKLKLTNRFKKLLERIKASKKYVIVSLDIKITEAVTISKRKLEMHDNIIVSTAKSLNLPLVTKDPQIKKVYKNTIW